MRCFWGCLFLFFLLFYSHADINELYQQRLDHHLEYKQARLKLEEAAMDYSLYSRNYIPSISIRTAGSQGAAQGINMTNGEFNPYTINTGITFEHIFGTTIEATLPYSWNEEEGHRILSPSIRVSRQLFDESHILSMEAKAALISADYKIKKIEADVALELIQDVYTAGYLREQETIYTEYTAILEENLQYITIEEDRHDIKRRMLSMKKLLLTSSFSQEKCNLDDYIDSGKISRLYEEVIERLGGIGKKVDKDLLSSRQDIQAGELLYEAAQKRGNLRFLPYFPNPSFYGSLTYNIDEEKLEWGIGLTFAIPLIDHGERALESRTRVREETLARLTLENQKDNIEQRIKELLHQIDIASIDLQILDLDNSKALVEYREAKRLYEKGIINEYEYLLKKFDYELSSLSIIEKQGSYYNKVLLLMAEQGMDVMGVFQ